MELLRVILGGEPTTIFFGEMSFAALIVSTFAFYAAFFFLRVEQRDRSTSYLGYCIAFVGLFNLGYLVGGALYHPLAAYHRWWTVITVLTVMPLFTLFITHYPRVLYPKLGTATLALQAALAVSVSTYFILGTRDASPAFVFSAGHWDFTARQVNVYVAYAIIGTLLLVITSMLIQAAALRGKERGSLMGMVFGFVVASAVPSYTNLVSREGLLPRGVHQAVSTGCFVLGLFLITVIYINASNNPTTFMAKIIGVALVTLLLILQGLGIVSLRDRDAGFDDARRTLAARLVESGDGHSTVAYRATLLGNGSMKPAPSHFSAEQYSAELKNALFLVRLKRVPPALRKQVMAEYGKHPYAAGYRAGLGRWLESQLTATAEDFQRSLQTRLARLNRMNGQQYARIAMMAVPTLRARLSAYLVRQKHPDFQPFRAAIRQTMARKNLAPAALKLRVLALIAPMHEPGRRLYRTAPDGLRHFVAYMHYDPRTNGMTEIGFPYLLYRRYIHRTAYKLTVMLVAVVAVVLLLYPLFFRGTLLGPLSSLLRGVERVEQGDTDVQVPVRIEDEIGVITRSFNRMVGSVRESRTNLEQKVEERTESLSEAFEKLKQMDELKTNFFANVSHELRTPLTLILSPIESMLQGHGGELEPAQRALLESTYRNSQKLLKLINNLLDFSKLEAGRMALQRTRFDLVAFVREVSAAFESAADQAGLEFAIDTTPDQLMIAADREKLDKVLVNLLGNAFKFTPAGGVTVGLTHENGKAQLSVRDTGVGIPRDKLQTIFERFSQVDGSASRKFEGTGIGLSLARELVELHGGTIEVHSQEGTGSNFIVHLPTRTASPAGVTDTAEAVEVPPAPRAAPQEGASLDSGEHDLSFEMMTARSGTITEIHQAHSGPTSEESPQAMSPVAPDAPVVLLVEDTPDMRTFVESLLATRYRVVTANNGREGLAAARREQPALILSDMMMPEMNGQELLAAVRRDPELRELPFILLTARAEVTMKVEGLDRGADDYIVKPFNSRELMARVQSQLRIRAIQSHIREKRSRLIAMNRQLSDHLTTQVADLMRSAQFRSYLPPQLAARLDDRVNAPRSERKKLSIFFSHISNFGTMTERIEAEDLTQLLNEYLSAMTAVADEHGGTIDKFVGDAMLVHFGDDPARQRSEREDAHDCLRMALAMQERAALFSQDWLDRGHADPVRIQCGLNTGYCAVGSFGSERRLDYTVIGSNVNLASRIMSHAGPDEILISHATRALVRDSFTLVDAGRFDAKGFERSVQVYRVEG